MRTYKKNKNMTTPSLAMIPTGFKAGKLYSVLPTPTDGAEEVVNGDFATDTDWSEDDGWDIDTINNVAICDNSGSGSRNLRQNSIVEVGKTYEVKFDLNVTSGTLYIIFGGTTGLTESKSYTLILTSTGTDLQFRNSTGNFIGSIDNVSIKEVLVGDGDFDVTRASAATRVNEQGLIAYAEIIGDEEVTGFNNGSIYPYDTFTTSGNNITSAIVSSSFAGAVSNSISILNGKTYKVTFTYTKNSGDNLRVLISNGISGAGSSISNAEQVSEGGNIELFLVATSTTTGYLQIGTGSSSDSLDISITNISVKEVTRNNVPRIDYTDGGCPVLLTEPQSTNLITYSEDFSNASWNKSGTTVTGGYSSPSADNPTGAFKLVFDGSSNLIKTNKAASANSTASIWIKGVIGETIKFETSSSTIITLTGEWQRIKLTSATSVTTFVLSTYSGVTAREVYIFGAQLEQLPYATSYIPTNGSTVTRVKDVVNNAGDVNTFNSEEGVLFVEAATLSNGLGGAVSISDGTTSNYIYLYFHPSGTKIVAKIVVGGSVKFDKNLLGIDETLNNKFAFKYSGTVFSVWVNGIEMATEVGFSFPIDTLISCQLDNGSGSGEFFGKTKQLKVFKTALSDDELEYLTTYGNIPTWSTYNEMALGFNYTIQ